MVHDSESDPPRKSVNWSLPGKVTSAKSRLLQQNVNIGQQAAQLQTNYRLLEQKLQAGNIRLLSLHGAAH